MTITDQAPAFRLAERLLDGRRRHPVLGISVEDPTDAARLDTGSLTDQLPGGEVHVLVGPEATWTLKRALPDGLDVYGRAVRLWWPSPGGLALREHPRGLLDEDFRVGGQPLAAWLEDQLARGPQLLDSPRIHGIEQQAVVLSVNAERAVVRLADAGTAELPATAFAGAGGDAARLVRVAQTLRVRAHPSGPGQPRTATPVWTPEDARAHLRDQWPVGSTILGRVSSLRSHGALVSLLPGVLGTVDVGQVSGTWIRHVEEQLEVGQVIAVRILDHAPARPTLSLLDTSPEPSAPSLLPDGPPWLGPPDHLVPWEDTTRADPDEAPLATELPAGKGFGDAVEVPTALSDDDTAARLLSAVHRARDVREDLLRVTEVQERHVAGLRDEARQLLRDLEHDLAEARERVIATTSGTTGDLVGNAEEALATARNEVARLRREVRILIEEQAEVTARAEAAEARAQRAERASRNHQHRAELHARTAASLRTELDRFAPESQRVVEAIRASWVRTTTHADREEFPWREPIVGEGFLMSLHRVEGINLERVYDVCAEVACGRARQRHSLAVHALRATDTSGSPQKVRDDGARAFRASLQSQTSAARRLHYWELTDGRIELAKIGYHDDFTI